MAQRRLPEKLYRIGEVMEHSGLSRQTLHLYATIGLIKEKRRTAAGYRLFPPSVFASLERVRELKRKGYTLRQIRDILEGHATRPGAAAPTETTESPDRGRAPATGAGDEDDPDSGPTQDRPPQRAPRGGKAS